MLCFSFSNFKYLNKTFGKKGLKSSESGSKYST